MSDWNKQVDKIGENIAKAVGKLIGKAQKAVDKEVDPKVKKIRAYRKEASRLASMANKRLARLEKAGLKDSPAYKKWADEGGVKFGVRGKTHNELQQEVARMNKFINAQTSTIRGVNNQLKEMAKNTGIQYSSLKELRSQASVFFELSSKIEQYLRTVDDMASAIGYQKIWTAVNQYVKTEQINLAKSKNDIDRMVRDVTKALREFDKPMRATSEGFDSGWFKLPKN